MKTIKVIDLLSDLSKYAINIKNKSIRYYDKNNDCYDECTLREEDIIYRLYYGNIRLNDKIEIIKDTPKEDKKIAKLDTDWYNVFDVQARQDFAKMTLEKINEIIERLNGEE